MSVLVIEDDDDIRDALSEVAEESGCFHLPELLALLRVYLDRTG